ncbi:MAG TPA: recombinase family protein [Candidatus Paceibacterota bacterium]|nr:recombinase family protein [Candidatus Paceibacterota bacterium]
MAEPTNPEELLEALKLLQAVEADDPEVIKKYRYVIYARKSTDEKDKQQRSLGDQVRECEEFAGYNNLTIAKIIEESESAKEPDIRPKFRTMMNDVAAGKYQGIIAWHPDRLSRNMKEAGEIIDLLDKGIIKDLKFKSFTFVNDASGKMTLGITFVLAKQYSEQLGANIARGNKRSIEEGKYPNRTKPGYYKDGDGRLRPDGQNFILIKRAFQMRLEGATCEKIADFLNENGYQRWNKDGTHTPFKMSVRRVYDFMLDPAYAGVIVYGKKGGGVNLMKEYDFQPAISVPDFMKINNLTDRSQVLRLARKYRRHEDVRADLMRGMVFCSKCGENMGPGITAKKNVSGPKNYLYYRCTTPDCPRKGKSTRARVITDYILDFLAQKPFSSRRAYEHYAEEMPRVAAERERNLRTLLVEKKTERTRLENKMAKIRDRLLEIGKDEKIAQDYQGDLAAGEKDLKGLEGEIGQIERKLKASKAAILTYEQFLELWEKTPKILAKMKPLTQKDAIIRKMFSNFTVSAKNVEKMELAEPFKALCDPKLLGGGDRSALYKFLLHSFFAPFLYCRQAPKLSTTVNKTAEAHRKKISLLSRSLGGTSVVFIDGSAGRYTTSTPCPT